MKIKLFCFIIFVSVIAPQNLAAQRESMCDSLINISYDFIWRYDETENIYFLDSAQFYLDEAFLYCRDSNNLILRKLNLFSYKHQYDLAINYLDNCKGQLYPVVGMPFFWSNCKNRFFAMKYAYAGDTIKRNEYIGNIIKNIEEYLQDNQESLDSICVLEDLAYMMHQTLPWVLVRYYYYLSIIDSQEVIKNKIDILLKKGYNMDFLELLNTSHEDFLIFTGF